MSTTAKIGMLAGAAVMLVALFLVLRPAGGGEQAPPEETPPATTGDGGAETNTRPASPPPPSSRPRAVRVAVTVRNGAVAGGVERASVRQGRDVLLVVTADVRDHVHVHGYDLLADVAPGSPARIRFTADVPGQFEVELEERHLLVAEIAVRP